MSIVKKIFNYVFFIGIVVFFGVKLYFYTTQLEQGDIAPNFKTTLINGSSFELNQIKGDWILLDFWASWCGPCLQEIPELLALREKHKNDLTIVTIGLERNAKNGLKASQQFGFDWKYQILEENKYVVLSTIAQKYSVDDIPAKFLINPKGEIISIQNFKDVEAYLK